LESGSSNWALADEAVITTRCYYGLLVQTTRCLYHFRMERDAAQTLDIWSADPRRLPLVIRGARQVGKTWLVRDFAQRHGHDLIECNFERDPNLARAFISNDPRQILGDLALELGRDLDPTNAVLFLDEIQAASEVLPKLRWFAEEMPELPVLAAGSLLEFTLGQQDQSMPVGRISYMHLNPMSFPEYLRAKGQARLVEALEAWGWERELSETALAAATEWIERYAMVGGMPAVVLADTGGAESNTIRRLQSDLLSTFLDDFGKYAGRTSPELLVATLESASRQLGGKFVYKAVQEGVRSEVARRALELLARAGLCHIVRHSSANGVPLGGEVRPRNRKVILLDVGLTHALLDTPAAQTFPRWQRLAPTVRGALAEQLLGQQLLAARPPWAEPELYYWQRGAGRPGEIDFLVQVDSTVVPVEAKAGAVGSLKSLHQFMHDKGLELAVRCDANPPSLQTVGVETTQGDAVEYRLAALPQSLIWRLHALAGALLACDG